MPDLHRAKPGPPLRGRATPPTQAPNLRQCPGCGGEISMSLIACGPCYNSLPSGLKASFADTRPQTTERKRVVAGMRAWLRGEQDA